ncbi:GntR family transcriptional regulator [Telmatospirillum sp.]|uniref:GntR family transcriptional regulator n=1 Tax=Telmatospirillum sp. TaxID=2079197 RepID=UPI00283BF88D|nr:GntR family transcriptional regulator [Telmatospirillum sp.]MDR3437315.1 GntR family transcriptional regulator [Telmatospirillum sp.]
MAGDADTLIREDAEGTAPGTMTEEAIYQVMHAAITERRLPAGMRLVEDQLARLFCVSRARIRAVLQALARDRMVTSQKNRGAFVSYPSVSEAREVFQARRLIETALVREAARIAPVQGVAGLRRHLELENAAVRQQDRRGEIKLSGEFHLLIAEMVGNPTLTGYLVELIARSSLVIAVYEGMGATDCWLDEHRRIVEALAAGDGDAAARLVESHLADVESRLRLNPDAAKPQVDFKTIFGV